MRACVFLLALPAIHAPAAGAAPSGPVSADALVSPAETSIRSGNIILKVSDFPSARAKVLRLARQYGATLREAQTEVNLAGEKHGELALQLDAGKLDDLTDDLRKIGKLYSERLQTTDQTALHQRLGERIRLLRQNESELIDFLRRPRRMRGSDILFVQYRLYQTRVETADASQERLGLERRARRSLLNVMLFEPEPRATFDWGNWHAHAVGRAKGAFMHSTRKLVTGVYFLGWFAPFWIPVAIAFLLAMRWARRRFRAWRAARPPRPAQTGPTTPA